MCTRLIRAVPKLELFGVQGAVLGWGCKARRQGEPLHTRVVIWQAQRGSHSACAKIKSVCIYVLDMCNSPRTCAPATSLRMAPTLSA